MARHRFFPRRSAGEWGLRSVLALLVLVCAYVGVTRSLAAVVMTTDPASAHRLAAGDGRITAALAAQRLIDDQSAGSRPETIRLAKLALRQDATAIRALVALGLAAQLRDEATQARDLFAYAEQLSRRDLQVQLWAIEDAVARDDVADALRHYDIALRAAKGAPDLLFPVLATAIADPRVRPQVVRTLAARPLWAASFIEYVAANAPEPTAAAQLLAAIGADGQPISGIAQSLLVERLVSRGMLTEAWRYYASFRVGVARDQGRDADFSADLDHPTMFDWQSVAANGLVASIQRGFVDFAAPAATSGPLIQQIEMLPPGIYRVDGRTSEIAQSPDALPYWQLLCRAGRELGRVTIPSSIEADGRFTGQFVVPADCPVQTLTLMASASGAIGGLSGQIQTIRVVRADEGQE